MYRIYAYNEIMNFERNKTFFAGAVFMFFLSTFLLTSGGHLYRFDGYTMFLATKSLAAGRLDIKPEYSFAVKGKDGKFYSPYEIGFSAAAVPFYLTGKLLNKIFATRYLDQMVFSFTNSFFAAVLCLLFFYFGIELGFGRRKTIALTFILAFGTLIWPYSKFDGYEILSSLILLAIIFNLYVWRKNGELIYFAAAAALYAFSIFFRITSGGLFPILLLYLYKRNLSAVKNLKTFILFLTPFAAAVILLFVFNFIRFGRFIIDPRQFFYTGDVKAFKPNFLPGIAGLLFSPGKSVFLYSPVLLAIFFNIKKIITNKTGAFFTLLTIYFIFFYSFFYRWSGDWCWGPRYLLPVIPFLVLCIGFIYEDLIKNKTGTLSLIILTALGIFVNFSSVAVNQFNYFIDKPKYHSGPENSDKKYYSLSNNNILYQAGKFIKITTSAKKNKTDKNLNYFQSYRANRFGVYDFWLIYLYNYGVKPLFIFMMLSALLLMSIFSFLKILSVINSAR